MLGTNCWQCGKPYKSEQSVGCSYCGRSRAEKPVNQCETESCLNFRKPFSSEERYCDLCLKPTTFGKEIEKALGH